ncbi:hypothetical protein F909_00724 [Acinetobacter sp. ANC 3929]|uniref:LysR family transcriptional regulator n=1 Tax=unclassified Acinetobacter TaxID=196816 RepID=UPI0002D1394B|nr:MULTISPECIES: LysR family transcriptional regulator [unclassified Acinetobacter]ENW83132.1 hypothetical protein F909_00724 [Acinetobacter sp. ANC 3929]MCH7351244.1 LysR family transcriptional regulator [Acinetobacter sp. NIPH 2023]MCH7359097.1 LysR family transcriptional regulator [Acinetobacter sp. NIPH 2024]
MDRFSSLNVFIQVAEFRSFTLVGQKLGLSASAIGKIIAKLEKKLNVRLFHRSTRSIQLTPEGALFLKRCRQILAEVEEAELELSQINHVPQGRLRVSLPLVGMLMMPTLTQFIQAWPAINLDLDFSDHLVDVIEEGFDVVIRTGALTDSRLMAKVLGTYHYQMVGSPAYFVEHGIPQALDELATRHCLRHRYPSTGKIEAWPLQEHGKPYIINLPVSTVANNIESIIYMVEQGLGIACLPDFAIKDQIQSGRLISIMHDKIIHAGHFNIVWPSNRYLSPKTRVFIDFMQQYLFPDCQKHDSFN